MTWLNRIERQMDDGRFFGRLMCWWAVAAFFPLLLVVAIAVQFGWQPAEADD